MTDQIADEDRHIVVGIDGSPGSRTALAWAMTQARLTGATVEAIAAWQESVMPLGSGHALSETGYLDGLGVAAVAQKVADDTVAAGMQLGSVSQHCVQHASGPVVVVPITDRPADPRSMS
jgi:nucleotide-binding universal stress UspA family protein